MRATFVLLFAVGLLFVFVFPARTLLAQRGETAKSRSEVKLLREQNRRLEQESKRLQNDAEIERIARERYNMVHPGEQPYVVVPPPATTPSTTAPSTTAPSTTAPSTGSRSYR